MKTIGIKRNCIKNELIHIERALEFERLNFDNITELIAEKIFKICIIEKNYIFLKKIKRYRDYNENYFEYNIHVFFNTKSIYSTIWISIRHKLNGNIKTK